MVTPSYDAFGCTDLHNAIIRNDHNAIKNLVANGWDVNVCNLRGETPLHFALWCSTSLKTNPSATKDIIRLLLELGANTRLRTHYGMSCQDIALHTARPDLIELIDGEVQRLRILSAVCDQPPEKQRTRKM
ncbi:ankyrin repeat domain-containing protein [Stenotrophomonas maltophilia]|uniref:ankyrin repeat domain-containing protein n=1 Tax=Stenotrophomonas maltophilia TaxID=40324 RepID=UPI001311E722|nr:ankyrin repeat domain-containing protein [Stenotrophomonas maltophilia]